jgi:hypothetical protein
VVGVAVDLDDEALRAPDGVDLVAGDPGVGLGRREAGPADLLESFRSASERVRVGSARVACFSAVARGWRG